MTTKALEADPRLKKTLDFDCVCEFATLLDNAIFATNHNAYACNDSVLGAVHCHVAIVDESIVHGHILSSGGSTSVLGMKIHTGTSEAVSAAQPRSRLTSHALYTLLKLHISSIAPEIRDVLEEKSQHRCAWDLQYVAKLASSLEAGKTASVLESIRAFLMPKIAGMLNIDWILEQNSSVRELLPDLAISKTGDPNFGKVPMPPTIENVEKRENLMHEILATERTYVQRMKHLLKDYATPLRTASRKQRGILGKYETNALFPSSLDAIVLLNEDFLKSLESSNGDFEFAQTLATGFKHFRKVYARYLESSSDLDQTLKSSLKIAKFKDFVDATRATANATVGIRELVMEPISRIPRYSLLITSLLAVITPSNPAYQVFFDALTTARQIGSMERDHDEVNQEIIMKLAALVSSWPSDLVKSSVRVVSYIDCLDQAIVPGRVNENGSILNSNNMCSLILFSDRLIFIKRARNVRLEEVLSDSKKGELGYRGHILLDDVEALEGEDCIHAIFKAEVSGVNSARWTGRPYRKFMTLTSEAQRFVRQINSAQAKYRSCEQPSREETFRGIKIMHHVYNQDQWKQESIARKSSFRVKQDPEDTNDAYSNVVVTCSAAGVFSCKVREGQAVHMLCREVSIASALRNSLYEHLLTSYSTSWLNHKIYDFRLLIKIRRLYSDSLLAAQSNTLSPVKLRPTSPSKIMTSFLGLIDRESTRTSQATILLRSSTEPLDRSFAGHTITKKKSSQLFSFGGEKRGYSPIETFVTGILTFEVFLMADFSAADQMEQKQANSLVAMITKDPKKVFAILGSPARIALLAFKIFCQTILPKRLGTSSVLSDLDCFNLKSHLKHNADTKRSRIRLALKALPPSNYDCLQSILRCGKHILSHSQEASGIQCFLMLSEMLVPPLAVTSFIRTMEYLLEEFDVLFRINLQPDTATMNSTTSRMTLQAQTSQFGSISSASRSYYHNEPDTLSNPSRSDARRSSYGGTPELGTSSTDDTRSSVRSRSGSSAAISLESEQEHPWKRATIHVDKNTGISEMYSIHSAMSSASLQMPQDKELPAPPFADHVLTRSHSDQPYRCLGLLPFQQSEEDTSKNRSHLTSCNVQLKGENQTQGLGLVSEPDTSKVDGRVNTKADKVPSRIVTPSRIPIASPKLISSPGTTPTHSRAPSSTLPLSLNSRKESGLPRLPSTLLRRTKSKPLSQSFSDHEFGFDSDLTADLVNALRFSEASKPVEETTPEIQAAGETPALHFVAGPHRIDSRHLSREYLRREIASESRITSTATIRRVSRHLKESGMGSLDIKSQENAVHVPHDTMVKATVHDGIPSSKTCIKECQERFDMLTLELQHYKTIYRAAVEEIDVTLDLANEQIGNLQAGLEAGSLEAIAMGLLELEKEQTRKLRMEISQLQAQR